MQGALLGTWHPYYLSREQETSSRYRIDMINSKHFLPTLTFEEVVRILQLQTSDV